MSFQQALHQALETDALPQAVHDTLLHFAPAYLQALTENGYSKETGEELLTQHLSHVIKQIKTPYAFPPYHAALRTPFDYYRFGLDFLKPLILFSSSTVEGKENVETIAQYVSQGDNVILLANHQTEPDPQAISLLLEKKHPKLAREMIFVAGQRVLTDPLAVPFSLGRNLLCIYAKKYIDAHPEEREERTRHNQTAMKRLKDLLSEGGKCIYVAPAGGRDRPNSEGTLEVAPFDPQSIALFSLTARRAAKPTHFFPLALATYSLLPPPNSINVTIGEERTTKSTAIHLSFGKEIEMTRLVPAELTDKKEQQRYSAEKIWSFVHDQYQKMPSSS